MRLVWICTVEFASLWCLIDVAKNQIKNNSFWRFFGAESTQINELNRFTPVSGWSEFLYKNSGVEIFVISTHVPSGRSEKKKLTTLNFYQRPRTPPVKTNKGKAKDKQKQSLEKKIIVLFYWFLKKNKKMSYLIFWKETKLILK